MQPPSATPLLPLLAVVLLLLLLSLALAPAGGEAAVLLGASATEERQLAQKVQEVRRVLEGADWYAQLMRLLRLRLEKSRGFEIGVDKGAMSQRTRRRRRRSAADAGDAADPKVEVSAELRVDGRTFLNVTKLANASRLGDSNEIINADIGDTRILLNVQVMHKQQQKAAATAAPAAAAAAAMAGAAAAATAAAEASADRSASSSSSAAAAANSSTRIVAPCNDTSYCLFGGTCTKYEIIDLQLCSCRHGFKGSRCELYDVPTVLSTLEAAHKRGAIGFGPISDEEMEQLMSVVESTAMLHLQPGD